VRQAPVFRTQPRECARTDGKGRAWHAYAHDQGILHLSRSSAGKHLLDGNSAPMVERPSALAKGLDQNSGLTRKLETTWNPGLHRSRAGRSPAATLTSAADRYSLGAHLFYSSLGGPPFVRPELVLGVHSYQAAATPGANALRSLASALDANLGDNVFFVGRSDLTRAINPQERSAEDREHWLRYETNSARTRLGGFSSNGAENG